jgi:hypothetical protein
MIAMLGKIRNVLLVVVLLSNMAFGQYNLVPNPSFAICTIDIIGQIDNPLSSVNVIFPLCNNPHTSSPDYLNPVFFHAFLF